MWNKNLWHKFTAVILATAMLLTTLTVPSAMARDEVQTVVSTDAEGQEVTDIGADKEDSKEQEPTDTKPDSEEPEDKEEASLTETPVQSDEADTGSVNTPTPSDTEEFKDAETLLPSDTESSDQAEPSSHSDKENPKDTKTTEQPNTEQSGKQEQFLLKGTVTLKDLAGNDIFWKDILVRLYDADTYDEKAEHHTYISETLTKKDGTYTFEDVEPGNYRIEFINRNRQYDDIACKWKKPVNGEKKIYMVEMTGEKVGLNEDNKEDDIEDSKESSTGDNEEDNKKYDEEQKEYFAFIKKLALPQEDLLRTEQEDTYMEVNLDLVEKEREDESEKETSEPEEQTSETAGPDTESESENTEETDAATEEAEEATKETEEDFSGMMSIEDLKHIDGDIAGATMEKVKRSPYDIMPMLVSSAAWSFDAYYVDEDNLYDVTKTDSSFKLKYQIEFRAKNTIAENAVTIRIPRVLFQDRNGNDVVPADIAVPQEGVESNSTIPFKYRVETDSTGTEYLVFFNYKAITEGTNIAFQVLYKNLEAMNIKDMTEWTLQPELEVDMKDSSMIPSEPLVPTPLKGHVDTGVNLTSVTKSAFHKNGASYTPGLYTKTQLKSYVPTLSDNSKYMTNFKDYKFVVWKVDVKGTATQPWSLEVKDNPASLEGEVVGYSAVDSNYWTVTGRDAAEDYTVITSSNDDSIIRGGKRGQSCSFYVVTAYPNDVVHEEEPIYNTIDVRLRPTDGEDPVVNESSTANWSYANYSWEYNGKNFKLEKNSTSGTIYSGWLELYRRALEKNVTNISLPELKFTINGDYQGYGLTHVTDSKDPDFGERIEGNSYTVTTVDDFVYAYPNQISSISSVPLDGNDYYYSSITVTSTDRGYDVYEDDYTSEPEDGYSTDIYVMYADTNPDLDGDNQWEKVYEMPWEPDGEMKYTFSSPRMPWRVKVVHKTTNYETDIKIDVNMRLRTDSPKLKEILNNNPKMKTLTIENLAGSAIEVSENNRDPYYIEEGIEGDGIYKEGDGHLEERTRKLYDMLLYRNPEFVDLTGLDMDAGAYKSGRTTNDPNNNRTLVEYQLSAYDGYKVQSKAMADNLRALGVESPGRKDVVFYDLLPYGMRYDPSKDVKALQMTGDVGSNAWSSTNSSQVSVKKVEVTDNYNDTGRTRLAFHLHYNGTDSASFYIGSNDSTGRWKEHWGVSFTAYYDWKDMSVVKNSSNICAFMPAPEDNTSLLGTDTQVAWDDGNVVPESLANDCKYFGSDIDGDGITDKEQTVLYAMTRAYEEVAVNTESKIQKLVRADSNVYGEYRENAVVAPEEGYTYDITVSTLKSSAENASIQDIVIFDRLEYASEDNGYDEAGSSFVANPWHGTFDSVITSGLEALGIKPVVYYHADRNAAIPANGIKVNDMTKFLEDNKWVKASEWEKTKEEVQAVAVDISKTADGKFELENGGSVTFQIKMKAPGSNVEDGSYAYNNPYYYSGSTAITSQGNYTSVKLRGMEELEVVKEFAGDIPDSKKNTTFYFYLTQDGGAKFSYQEYRLYKKNVENGWDLQDEGLIHTTDANGVLKLRADEKAVFRIADAGRVSVQEEENPYWKSVKKDPEDPDWKNTTGVRTITFTNSYRPVLFVQKKVSYAPDDLDEEFTFQVLANNELLAEQEFWYVDRAIVGGIPNKVTDLGANGIGKTEADGTFKIKAGQVIALFPGKDGTEYKVQELLGKEDSTQTERWICEKDNVTGTLPVNGSSVSITNIYAKKELYIEKKITHQDASKCNVDFKFQIWDVTDPNNEVPVSGKNYVIVDSAGNESAPQPLGNDGTFTAYLAGKTAKILGLDAKHTYRIKESKTNTPGSELYEPVQDTMEVTMPLYAKSSKVTFTNDYLKRSLTINERVIYQSIINGPPLDYIENTRFVMEIKIKDANGIESTFPDISLKNGESIFIEDIGMIGDTISVKVKSTTYSVPGPFLNLSYFKQMYPLSDANTVVLGNEDAKMNFIHWFGNDNDILSVMKDVSTMDESSETCINSISNFLTESSPSIELPEFHFILRITDNTGTYTWPKEAGYVEVVNIFKGSTRSMYVNAAQNKDSYFTLRPGDMIVITGMSKETAYSLTEIHENSAQLYGWKDGNGKQRWFEFSQKEPENNEAVTGTVGDSPAAVIVNEMSEITNGSRIEKRMIPGRNAVSEGALLVWQLQRYNGSSWKPAEGVSYVLLNKDGDPGEDGILTTGTDGRIILKKVPGEYPTVQFTKEKDVHLNYYGEAEAGDLRLVELMDESDESWGRLAYYGNVDNDQNNLAMEDAVAFVNSNRTVPIEIAKDMEAATNDTFTMYLEQVVSISSGNGNIEKASDIGATIAGSGMEYILYNSRTNREIDRCVTGANGEILLKAEQYARLYLPDKTLWTVSEELKTGYVLKDLAGVPDDDSIMKKLDANLMLIQPKGTPVPNRITAVYKDDHIVGPNGFDKSLFEVTVYDSDGTKLNPLDEIEFEIHHAYEDVEDDISTNPIAGRQMYTVYYPKYDLTTTVEIDVWGKLKLNKSNLSNYFLEPYTGPENDPLNYNDGILNIPEKLYGKDGNTYIVSGIGVAANNSGAFEKCTNITSIKIPDSVKEIQSWAFRGCTSLTSLDLGNGVEILGHSIVSNCSNLTFIRIPASVKECVVLPGDGGGIFGFAPISTFEIDENMKKIPDLIFLDCDYVESITIPDGVESIGDYAFKGCDSLTTVSLPVSLKTIGQNAFSSCFMLPGINIPDNVTTIGNEAFYNCKGLENIDLGFVTTIGVNAFGSCTNLKNITIPDSVTFIDQQAFSGCTALTSIKLSANITSIEEQTFNNCTSLQSVTIPNGVESIEYRAFSNCGLESINIPQGVTKIGDQAFWNCIKLQSVWLPESLETLGDNIFLGCYNLSDIYINKPEGSLDTSNWGTNATIHWNDD